MSSTASPREGTLNMRTDSRRSQRPAEPGHRSISSPRLILKTPASALLLTITLTCFLFCTNGAGRAQAQEISGDVPDNAGVFDAAKSAPPKLGSPAGPSSPAGGSGLLPGSTLQNLDLTKRENFSAA